MCFSAIASFTAGATLSALGIATLKKVRSRQEVLLGLFPVFFAAQQFCEGIVWLTIGSPSLSFLNLVVTYSFLLFATGVWPILCPLAAYLIEENSLKKRGILGMAIAGTLLGIYLFTMVVSRGVSPDKFSGNLLYELSFIPFYTGAKYLYLIVTSVPFLISSDRPIKLFGLGGILSFWLATLFYNITFVSVWCFFAAVLSGGLYFLLGNSQQPIPNIPEDL